MLTIRILLVVLGLAILVAGCQSQNPNHWTNSADIPLDTARRFHDLMCKAAKQADVGCHLLAFSELAHREGTWVPCGDVEWEVIANGVVVAIVSLNPSGKADAESCVNDFEGLKVVVDDLYYGSDNEYPNQDLKQAARRFIAVLKEQSVSSSKLTVSSHAGDHGLSLGQIQQFHRLMADVVMSEPFDGEPLFDCAIAGFPSVPVCGYDTWQPQRDIQWAFFARGSTNAALTVRLVPKGQTPPEKCLLGFYGFDAVIHYSYEQESGGDLVLKEAVRKLCGVIRETAPVIAK